jgi:hypothetical protein
MRKADKFKFIATGSFLRQLRRRLLILILLAVLPILSMLLYQAKLARDIQVVEVLEDAWATVENVAIREARFIDAAKQILTLLADTVDVIDGDATRCRVFAAAFFSSSSGPTTKCMSIWACPILTVTSFAA